MGSHAQAGNSITQKDHVVAGMLGWFLETRYIKNARIVKPTINDVMSASDDAINFSTIRLIYSIVSETARLATRTTCRHHHQDKSHQTIVLISDLHVLSVTPCAVINSGCAQMESLADIHFHAPKKMHHQHHHQETTMGVAIKRGHPNGVFQYLTVDYAARGDIAAAKKME